MSELTKQAAVGPRGLRRVVAHLSGRTVRDAHHDLEALRRVSEIAGHPDVPKLLRGDLRRARAALEHAKNQQFDSRAGAGFAGAAVIGGAGAGTAEYFRQQRRRDLERYYGPTEKQASAKTVTKSVLSSPVNMLRHANGGKINDYMDTRLGMKKSVRNSLSKKPYSQIAEHVENNVSDREKRRVLRDLGKLNAKRRAAKMGILGLGATAYGTHYKLTADKQKKNRRSIDQYVSYEPAQPEPGYQLVASQDYFNRG